MLPAIAVNLRWMVLGVGGAKAVAVGNVAARAVLALGVLVFVHRASHHHPLGLHRVPFLAAAAELVYALVILGAVARRFGLVVPKIDLRAWIATLRESLPLLASALARAAFYAFDVVAIELIRGPHSVGIYTAASKPVLFITSAIGLFSISFLSSLSGLRGPAARRLLQKALRASLLLSIPIAAVLSAASILIVPFLFGHAYERSSTILAVLAWRTPIVAATSLYGGVLITANLQRRVMRNNVLGALFLVAGDVAAIPLVGLMGAAVVSVAGAVLILALNYSDVRRLDPGSDPSAPVRNFGA
jgi:O-antigen/teichoic acid export membrane protein